MIIWVAISVVLVLCMGGFAFWIKRSLERTIESRLEVSSTRVMKDNLEAILTLAGNTLEEKARHVHDNLADKEKSFQSLVAEVQSQIQSYQRDMKMSEQDRAVKFSEILNVTAHLTQSTEKLNQILNTNNLRGQWGERIAEDILRSSGLIEGIHYEKNKQLETTANRPDFTFFLPDEHKVNMDVKFPISNLVKSEETPDENEKRRYLKKFESDVRERIQEITCRGYVNPAENTVDFAILFVPNESIYGAIHKNCRDLFDFAEEKKIILAAPFTLIAILKVILQSFRYFHYEKRLQDMVILIEKLGGDLVRFRDRFELFDEHLKKMRKAYDEIAETSFRKIYSKIDKLEQYKIGGEARTEVSSPISR